MKIQMIMTDKIKSTYIEDLGLSGKAYNYLRRREMHTIEDVVKEWDTLGDAKGIGDDTVKRIQNSVINYMIQNLPEKYLIDWVNYLLDNNPAETLRAFFEGFAQLQKAA